MRGALGAVMEDEDEDDGKFEGGCHGHGCHGCGRQGGCGAGGARVKFVFDDGGRAAAGFSGEARDCVARSIAIASGLTYRDVYAALSAGSRTQRRTKRSRRIASARDGVYTGRKWFREYMEGLGFRWTPTMRIGTGCQVHLVDGELPGTGRLVVAVSKHYTAVIDGVIHDTHDPQREAHCIAPYRGQALKAGEWLNSNGVCSVQRRCVYGYWRIEEPVRGEPSRRGAP